MIVNFRLLAIYLGQGMGVDFFLIFKFCLRYVFFLLVIKILKFSHKIIFLGLANLSSIVRVNKLIFDINFYVKKIFLPIFTEIHLITKFPPNPSLNLSIYSTKKNYPKIFPK